MGYYTKYRLKPIATNVEAEIEKKAFYNWCQDTNFVFDEYATPDEVMNGYHGKWYDWNKEMLEFSKKFPLLVFQLDGSGQEGEFDEWRAFFKNGKYFEQRAELNFPTPDFSKLD